MNNLVLYYLPTCPYSLKVLRFLDRTAINIERRNIKEPENRAYLLENGGKVQVPCLFIGEKPMYESDDIINYLSKNTV